MKSIDYDPVADLYDTYVNVDLDLEFWLDEAGRARGDWRLEGCVLYVTLEPCPMCITACRQARLDLVVWGADDPSQGACGSVIDLAEDPRLGPRLACRGGLLDSASTQLLRSFFAKRRCSS